jgi:adenylate kinase family enzyme
MTGRATPPDASMLGAVPRIVVVGTTGSGKTTLAGQLAAHLHVPHIELDALHWGPGWTPAAPDVFRKRVAAAVQGDAWVTDGNYRVVRDVVWDRAAAVVWLDYPLPVILWRLLRRTLRRVLTREQLWNGNREQFGTAFLSRESLFVWAVQTHQRRRRHLAADFAADRYRHLKLVRLRSPGAAQHWLAGVLETPRA